MMLVALLPLCGTAQAAGWTLALWRLNVPLGPPAVALPPPHARA